MLVVCYYKQAKKLKSPEMKEKDEGDGWGMNLQSKMPHFARNQEFRSTKKVC